MLFAISLQHRGLKHYIVYCMKNGNLKTAHINPVPTEWIVLVWSIKYGGCKKEFTYSL